MRASEATIAMLETTCQITRRRFAYSIGNHIAFVAATALAYFHEPRGGNLMSWFTSGQRGTLATIVLVVASCLPGAAQEQRRGSYAPPAADAVPAAAAEHGMVVAQ